MGGSSALVKGGSVRSVGVNDLGCCRVPVVARASRGTPYTRWLPVGMPRIRPHLLNTVFYLYRSEEEAAAGTEFGGTGFVVYQPSSWLSDGGFAYAVTNHHVACTGGASVIRMNMMDGGTEIFPFGPEDWCFDPKYDIAVIPLPVDWNRHQAWAARVSTFTTKERLDSDIIGVGDDVFMIDRFVDHDGGASNRPAARFGHISVMPSPIEQPNGRMTDAYCIDMHSRTGYSGSPVFVYRTIGSVVDEPPPSGFGVLQPLFEGHVMLQLLGIHFAQFAEPWQIAQGLSEASREASGVSLITEGAYVKGLSGMGCVLPAWTILEVLNLPALQRQRQADEDDELRRRDRHPPAPE